MPVTAIQISLTNEGIESTINSIVNNIGIDITKFRLSYNGDDDYYNNLKDYSSIYNIMGENTVTNFTGTSENPLLYYLPFTAEDFEAKNNGYIINLGDYGYSDNEGFMNIESINKKNWNNFEMQCYIPPIPNLTFFTNEIMIYTSDRKSFAYAIFPNVQKIDKYGLNLKVTVQL